MSCLIPSHLLATFAGFWYTTQHIQCLSFFTPYTADSCAPEVEWAPQAPDLKPSGASLEPRPGFPRFSFCVRSQNVLFKATKRRVSIESNRDSRVLPPWDDPLCVSACVYNRTKVSSSTLAFISVLPLTLSCTLLPLGCHACYAVCSDFGFPRNTA